MRDIRPHTSTMNKFYRLPGDANQGPLEQVGKSGHRLHGNTFQVFLDAPVLNDAKNVVIGPGQLLELDQPIVGVDPDEFVGHRHVGVDGLERRVTDEPTHRLDSAFAPAQTRVGRRRVGSARAVRAERQLLDGHFDVLQPGGVLQLRLQIVLCTSNNFIIIEI